MIRFVPEADSRTGRWLRGLGRALGLRSETVYSRAILLTTIAFFLLGAAAVVGVWYALFRQFNVADEQELRGAAQRVAELARGQTELSSAELNAAARLLGRRITQRPLTPERAALLQEAPQNILLEKQPDGLLSVSFILPGRTGEPPREIIVTGDRSFHEAGVEVARLFLVGLVVAGGATLLLILFIVDRTILARIKLLADKVEGEKDAERLPVKLDFDGEDELAQLARSIEELARLVQAAEREYRHVVEDQTEGICRFDREWRITFSNRAFEALCILPPVGKRPSLEACLDAGLCGTLRDTLQGLTPESDATSFTHPVDRDGSATWYRSTVRASFDAESRWQGGQWISADVTNEVEAQRRLQDSQTQLQILSARLMNLQDEERRRIARDLHDSTAQALSALEMNTSLLENAASDDKSRQLAAETRAISRQVCQELRNISYLLHPPLLEERGLAFAIRWFADGFTKRNGIPVILDLPEDFPRLESDEETALFRIVQEALSNIYRHAGATKAWITLRRGEAGPVSLEVRDNGEGLPEGFSFSESAGVGLAGMRERMKHLGGILEVDSSPYGVSVRCRMPAVTSDL